MSLRVLFIVPYIPSLIRVRPYQFIRTLSNKGIKIILASIITTSEDQRLVEELKPYLEELITIEFPSYNSYIHCMAGVAGTRPLQSLFSWSTKLAGKIEQRISDCAGDKKIDLIHFEHIRGGRYGEFLFSQMSRQRIPWTPLVWDSVDSISSLFRQSAGMAPSLQTRLISRFELERTRTYERKLTKFVDRVLVTSDRDKDAFVKIESDFEHKITVVPNGVDLNYFTPGEAEGRIPGTILISGKMSYHANARMVYHFVNEIFPLILEGFPDAKLWIVGKDPNSTIQAYANDPRITVTGQVPDMRPYLQKASVAVAPVVYGTGIQNKVLEAMACSTPVVTTPAAGVSIHGENGVDYFVAETPEDFANDVVCLLNNESKRLAMGAAGRRFVEKRHDWDLICDELAQKYREIVNVFYHFTS
ncbi:glycosyltransferase [Ornatilinea apprima]|uniref:glycosyltransferase n=1 Tax=Ornatilinea apprima TaxID=1134406 RepID=UPI0009464322|nr:glycosyltransferase [Ornatilinea apprima]